MKQKRYFNPSLVVLFIVFIGILGILILIKRIKTQVITKQQSLPVASLQPSQSTVWENLLPTIRSVIGPTFLGIKIEETEPLSIFEKADITGDGIPEALVSLGNGSAYTIYLTLMRIENNKPEVVQFKQKDGKVSPLIFLSGASAMNGASVVMLPERKAIYAGYWNKVREDQSIEHSSNCRVEAYQWNLQTKTFDFNPKLSSEIKPDFCQKIENNQ